MIETNRLKIYAASKEQMEQNISEQTVDVLKAAVIYIHGKGGSATEAEHYKLLFTKGTVLGF